ncbi:MAG TPA: DUF2510 domain-containing protein [Nocardioides sp.]
MSTPEGWYDDGTGTVRWWDGERWTDHVQSAGTADPTAGGGSGDDVTNVAPTGGTWVPPEVPATPLPPATPVAPVNPMNPANPYGVPAAPVNPTYPPAGGTSPYGAPSGPAGQPPYGQPSFGQPAYGQPPFGQPPASKPPWLLIGGGVAAAVVLLLVLVLALALGGGGSPEDVVQEAFDANTCDEYEPLLTGQALDDFESAVELDDSSCDDLSGENQVEFDSTLEIRDSEVDGDDATVEITETYEYTGEAAGYDDFTVDGTVHLTDVDGEWKIERFDYDTPDYG